MEFVSSNEKLKVAVINNSCMNCRGGRLTQFIDLSDQPNGNVFLKLEELSGEEYFPLAMAVCDDCFQVQIQEFPPVETMFRNHPYISGVSKPVVEHFGVLAQHIIEKFDLSSDDSVLDIGANDGSLLECFKTSGIGVIGVDPSENTALLAQNKGIEVVKAFWGVGAARQLNQRGLKIKVITATAVFYHMKDIHDFIKGLVEIMQDDSVFCAQCVDLLDILRLNQFDHLYHEHTMIHALEPLIRLFRVYGLKVIDFENWNIHGGSFVIYVAKEGANYGVSSRVEERRELEMVSGLQRIETYKNFAKRIHRNKDSLVHLLKKSRTEGKRIVALGAPLKGSTLLNFCGIGPELVECAVEVNPLKVGRVTPGTHIPVIHEDALDFVPDYYLCLAWNFREFFIQKYESHLNAGGGIIFPNPEVEIVGVGNQTMLR